ncbi:MAG: D-alanine--D-alanine ligase [Lachnospiraceae bacterium]|nr:D-alanine--D-alanine ligase [Lachnospiraceae bacterium]
MNIVVLTGGISTEREVSLVTGKGVCNALRECGHKAVLLDVFFGYGKEGDSLDGIFEEKSLLNDEIHDINVTDPDIEEIKKLRGAYLKDKWSNDRLTGPNVIEICHMADIVFMALHGADGENGRLQAAFDILGIKYTGTGSFGSSLAMDKFISKKILKEGGVPVPYGFIVTKKELEKWLNGRKTLKDNMFPCVVKPCCGGSSVGVSIANNKEEYQKALETAARYEDEILVEEYIKGRELSAGIVDGETYPVIEIIPKQGFYDYETKYQPGMADDVCPADISMELCNKIQGYAKKVYHMLKLEAYARIDFLLDEKGDIYCLEANTLPGMTPTSLLPQEASAVNVTYTELCGKIIMASLKKYRK